MNEILEGNFKKVINGDGGRSLLSYELNYLLGREFNTFGGSIYWSIITAFSSIFVYENLPEDFKGEEFEMFLLQSGRMKIIQVGNMIIPVHIVPKKYNHYYDWIESSIIEPYLPSLSGKNAELFNAVQIKNDVLGESIIRKIYPFINAIDEILNNLRKQQKILAGKFVLLASATGDSNARVEEDAANDWLLNEKSVKQLNKSMTDSNGDIPLQQLQVSDSTDSYIKSLNYFYNQMLNVLGIPSNNLEGKKERTITDEINIQNVLNSSIVENMLQERKKSVKEMNERFGTNIIVKLIDVMEDVYSEEVEDEPEDDKLSRS